MVSRTVQQMAGASIEKRGPAAGLQVKRILCPVDFSEFSERALGYASSLTRHFGARLFIQNTVHPSAYLFLGGIEAGVATIDSDTLIQSARDQVRKLLIASGISMSDATVLLNEGDATERILETVSKDAIDLIVMGTHGHKGFSRFVLGSVSEGIIHRAPCPVLVVGRPQRSFLDANWEQRPKTVLLATDFSSPSDRAVAYALRWGCEWPSKVVLFHAVQKPAPAMQGLVDLFPEYNPYFEQQVTRAWQKIQEIVPEEAQLGGCNPVYEVRHGDPKEEILKVAEEKNADLIITGARGAGGSTEAWGSVSSAVVRDGRFPVLVIREMGRPLEIPTLPSNM